MREERAGRRHLTWSAALAAVAVGGALLVPVAETDRGEGPAASDLRWAGEQTKAEQGLPHDDPPGMPAHDHSDPATKNAVSRTAETGAETDDPTTEAERAAGADYVEGERAMADPALRTVRPRAKRTTVPATRYAMAGGCYTLAAPDGRYLRLVGDDARLGSRRASTATGFYFKATDLGSYLLWAGPDAFLGGSSGVAAEAAPSPRTDWVVRRTGTRFTLRLARGEHLAASGRDLVLGATPTRFSLRRASGCTAYPEAQVDVRGRPHAGVSDFQEVRGYVDAHTHHMAYEFLGGRAHCGKPWDRYGVEYALVDCPDHQATGGYGSLLETVLSGNPAHDPVGWPTFQDWPAPESLTHEGTYYRWMERSWRGGQRLFVNLLVENNQLCQLYPLKKNSCDDMDSVRLQAQRMFEFQDYVDAQFGGPGQGFYRIVRDPFEARRVINSGKMAVVMGIETSVPFGCTFVTVLGNDIPACDQADIDRQLDEMHALGVRQMELVNKFDNAFGGVAGDTGSTGVAVNAANFLETGTFWDMRHCEPADGESHDREQLAVPDISAGQQDALFGAIGQLFSVIPAIPLYPPPAHCNRRGLTDLGSYVVDGLADRQMIVDPDHLSVKARQSLVDQVEEREYPGIVSSHSWSTPDAYPRIYRAGGFITPYAGDSTGFVDKWRRHVGWADPRYYFGFGYGADINGLGAQGNPRGADVDNPVEYPITGLNGVQIDQQRAGERVYDLNVDGVAQYGLYPDWIEDLRMVAGADDGGEGEAIVEDMERGAEAYLQMWERAVGVPADSCRNPELRVRVARVRELVRPGMTTQQVMRAVGQPYTRLGREFGLCAKTPTRARVPMTVRFSPAGRVVSVA